MIFSVLSVSLDGRTVDAQGGLAWQRPDSEFDAFARGQLAESGALLFGRRTYRTMASFWPTPEGEAHDPQTAALMNARPKAVVSRTLRDTSWGPATVLSGCLAEEVQDLADRTAAAADPSGRAAAVAVLGSPTLAAALLAENLLDEVRVLVNPVLLGAGPVLFEALPHHVPLELRRTHTFGSGAVLLTYHAAGLPSTAAADR